MVRVSLFIEAMTRLPNPQLFCTLAGYKGRAVEGGGEITCIDISGSSKLVLLQNFWGPNPS